MRDTWDLLWALIPVGVGLMAVAGWLTHVVVCIQTESWGFLIAGAIAAPVAVVHGVGLWFGAW